MRIVNFDKIVIKNFLSVGDEPVSINFKPGIHIITGTNKDKQDRRNGVGKSTVADAIHFAIFGATIRELKKDNISNNLTSGSTHVEFHFTIEKDRYKIIRTLRPSKCYLYINGKDSTRDSIINTTDYIGKLLNTSQEIFQNCVIMTLNNTVPFMGKKKIDKRKFIEGIFGLEVFSNMLSVARTDYNDAKKEYESYITRHEEVTKNLDGWLRQQADFNDKKNARVVKLNDRKTSNLRKIDEIETNTSVCSDKQLAKLQKCVVDEEKKIEKCENHLTGLGEGRVKQQSAAGVLKTTLGKIGTDKETCPVCLKSVTDHDRDDIVAEKKKIEKQISTIVDSVDGITGDITTYNGLKAALKAKLLTANKNYNDCILQRKEAAGNKEKIEQFHKWNKEVDE